MGAAVAALFTMVGLPAQEVKTRAQEAVAAAALAESKGDLAGAAAHLVKAWNGDPAELEQVRASLSSLMKAISPEKQREVLDSLRRDVALRNTEGLPDAARIRELLQEKGFSRVESARSSGQDPLQRLIAVLEEGTTDVIVVADAQKQLQALGALAVPSLVAALPKAGPFGLVNTMQLLAPHSDPRIAPALLDRANADPAIAALVIEQSKRMQDAVREALVMGIDEGKLPAPTRLDLVDAMGSAPGMDARRKAIALQLADEPSVQRELAGKVGKRNVPWASEVFTRLRASKDPVAAASATAQWLLAQQDLDEATALAAIQSLDVQQRWWVARQVTDRYLAWAKVALLGLGEGANLGGLGQQAWFQNVEWWRGGGDAALKLLEVAAANRGILRDKTWFELIIGEGWIVPPEAEAALVASTHVQLLAMALPKDDEARALAAWRRLDRDAKAQFVTCAVGLGRPWHRVVTSQLATAQEWRDVGSRWIERDWTGVPADAAAELLALAKRFPSQPVGQPSGTLATSSGSPAWPRALVAACDRTPDLPLAILVTFANAGDEFAWRVLAKRDPRAALDLVRDPSRRWLGDLAQLLGEHGIAADVPTFVRLLEWHGLSDDELQRVRPFVERHCRGNLDVADGLEIQARDGRQSKVQLAAATAAGVAVEQLAEVIERTPALQPWVAEAAGRAMLQLVAAAQAPVLVQALEKTMAHEPLSEVQVRGVLVLMQKCGAPECLPAVRRALEGSRLGDLVMDAAATAMAVAGPQRHAVLLELLDSNEHRIVQVALDAEGVGQDKELLQHATNAMINHGKQLGSVARFFEHLDPAARATQARVMLASADFARCNALFCRSVLEALGSLKDPRFVGELALGAKHPDQGVRVTAVIQLGHVFAREAAPYLLDALKDADAEVRKLAKQSLDQLAEYLDARAKWDERLQRK